MNYWLYALSATAIILLPFIGAVVVRRRRHGPWLYFITGVLTFLGAQAVHLGLNELLTWLGILPEELPEGGALVTAAIILGLTAGLTEEAARAIGYKVLPKARGFQDGLLMGLGHGGLEAIIVGVLVAAGASALWNLDSSGVLPQGALASDYATLEQQLTLLEESPLLALAPFVERVIALAAQVTLSIMVLFAFRTKKWLYLAAAIIYHTILDAGAVLAANNIENPWLVEGVLLLLVLPGVIWLIRQDRSEVKEKRVSGSLKSETQVFLNCLKKELTFQWRTKRLLIVVAVFAIFGMLSPVIARFTPELIGSIEEVADFANLIPEPSAVDSITQYVSNLSQFGFILVILLGMNAVAGEKEKGTAAMILSKPVPRWSFVVSKFVSQILVYLLALSVAGVSAYFYTIYLFEPIGASGFALGNGLLYLWLVLFAAVTLLGSSIGKTTASAAGIAIAGGIIILLVGVLPKYGVLFAGGLLSWASAAFLDVGSAVNGGSVAMAVGLILLLVVGSFAAVEAQEI